MVTDQYDWGLLSSLVHIQSWLLPPHSIAVAFPIHSQQRARLIIVDRHRERRLLHLLRLLKKREVHEWASDLGSEMQYDKP